MADLTMFDWACIFTAFVVPVPALLGAIGAWWTGDLGAGGLRPEPTVAALLANVSWLVYGCTRLLWEPILLNAEGCVIQALGLLVFLHLSMEDQERLEAAIFAMTVSVFYLASVLAVGLSDVVQLNLFKCLCTFAGSISAAAPLLTYCFLQDNPNADMLPNPAILGFNTLHGVLWMTRGLLLKDYYMATQNGLGMVCSLRQLYIALHFPQPNQEDPQGLLDGLLADQPAQEPVIQPVPEEMQQAQEELQPPAVPEEMQQAQEELQPPAVPEEMQQAQGELQPPAVPEEMQQAQGEMQPPAVPEEMQPAQGEILPGDDDDEEPGSGDDDDEEPGGGGGDDDDNVDDDDDDQPDEQVPVLPRRSARIAAIVAAAAAAAANH